MIKTDPTLGRVHRPPVLSVLAVTAALAAGCSAGSGTTSSAPSQSAAAPPTSPATSLTPSPTGRPTQTPAPSPTKSKPRETFVPVAHYVYPVQRCSSSYSSSHHDYPAADVFTQKGCAFVAVTGGRV